MKKFKKLAAALSAAIIAVSAFSIPVSVSAYYEPMQPYDYMVDESNIAWEEGYVRVYNDGTVTSSFRDVSLVAFKPAEGAEITAETLGLPDGYEIEEQDYSVSVLEGSGWLMIPTNSKERTDEIAAIAENWVKSGIALTAKKVYSCASGCMFSVGFSVNLKDNADSEEFLANYSSLSFEEDESIYKSKIFSQDEIVGAGEILSELKADEMVETATVYGMSCAALHQTYKTETIGFYVPDDFDSASEFYYRNAEVMTTCDPDTNESFAALVLPCIDDENYGYTFEDDSKFRSLSHERFIEDTRNIYDESYVKKGYDVYYIYLNPTESDEINITAKFGKISDTENYLSKTNLCFTRQEDGTFKVSDRPTTTRQVLNFMSKNGNIKVNDDNAIVIMDSVGAIGPYECTSPYNTVKPDLTTKYEIGTDDSMYSCRRNSNGEIVFDYPCGGGIYTIYQYSLDSNAKYGLKFISAQQYNETAETPYGYVTSYNYTIEKNGSGAKLVSESAEEYESTPYGDVNFDSVVDIYDAIGVSRYLLNPDSLNETELYAADFNRDGKNNIYDAIDIAKTLL